jgi:hypothetical protein|tara:strand:+ start:278 stop:640 length:363 start_codon:yes stop_codon:yes gene_type:complete
MANPNIVGVTTIKGRTIGASLTTSNVSIVNNNVTGEVLKINTIFVSNVDGTNAADVTATVYIGGNYWNISNTISVPADTTLVLVSKDTTFYLEENQQLYMQASANSDLEVVVSYESISAS